jgi:hypothetical protein
MAESQTNGNSEGSGSKPPAPARSDNEVALELMRYIATVTGYGKSPQATAGFSGKPQTRSVEEQADALLDLFERCRNVVRKD